MRGFRTWRIQNCTALDDDYDVSFELISTGALTEAALHDLEAFQQELAKLSEKENFDATIHVIDGDELRRRYDYAIAKLGSRFMNTSRRHEPGVARGHSEIAVALGCRPRSGWSARLGRDQPSPSPALALEVESSCRRLRPKNRGPDQRAPVISRATAEREW